MAIYNSSYTGAEVDASVAKTQAITKTPQQLNDLNQVNANPTLAGTENPLEGIEIGGVKYKNQPSSVQVLTTAPSQDNTVGYKFVITNTDPATKYAGYIYYITEA